MAMLFKMGRTDTSNQTERDRSTFTLAKFTATWFCFIQLRIVYFLVETYNLVRIIR